MLEERITIKTDKETRERWTQEGKSRGLMLSSFIKLAVNEYIKMQQQKGWKSK